LTDKKAVTLYIVEIPRVVAIELVDNATKFLEEMNASGMVLKDVNKLYDSINSNYANVEFGSLEDVYAQLALIYHNAFESKVLIEELTKAIADAKTNGLTTTESYKLLLLGQTIYERGDYALALERLKEAKLTYALETKGQYNLAVTIKNHPLESLGILLGLSLIGIGSGLLIRLQLLRRKLRMLNEEEVLLLELMKVIQKECFEKNHMSMEEYEAAMMQYENRLSQTVQEKISVETKIANLLKVKGKRIALGEEKARLISMVRKVQDDYLNKGKIETRIYENMVRSYTSRLSEVEEEIATLDAEAAVKKSKKMGVK
jgi:tetratricopeptide (TPR) repeat protein